MMSVACDDDDYSFNELSAAEGQNRSAERRMAAANALADFEGGSGNAGVAAAAFIRPAHPRPRAGVSACTGTGFFDQESVHAEVLYCTVIFCY